MKSIIAIALISLAFCGFINQEEVDFLKANAPFEVYEPEENPFRDYTNTQKESKSKKKKTTLQNLLISEPNGQTVLEKSETKLHAGHAGPSQVLYIKDNSHIKVLYINSTVLFTNYNS